MNGAKTGHNDGQELSESIEANSSKELSFVKAPEPICEPSVLILEKQVFIVSDLQQGQTIRHTKKDASMVDVHGKSEAASFLALTGYLTAISF